MRRTLIIIVLLFIFILNGSFNVYASDKQTTFIEDDKYHIVNIKEDGSLKEYATKDNYKEAWNTYEKKKKKASNAAIYYKQRYIVMEYGVASIKKVNECTYNVEYTNRDNGENGYTNGCYGVDAAYLSSDYENNTIEFRISDVNGIAKSEDIELLPWLSNREISSYYVMKGELIHFIKTDYAYRGYNGRITLGSAPLYLKEKQRYYSYDGQYFYKDKDYKKMIDDYREGVFDHSINKNKPYYNYYQYLPHRSVSTYSSDELNKYINQDLGINKEITTFIDEDHNGIHDGLNQSLFLESGDAFLQYQSIYGANALMMMALARNESANGRSAIAYTKNNLFGHSAFDSDAQANAARYFNRAQSIQSHALHYISGSYANPEKFMYHGSYFGNKESGMNVSYASDPYWGEKATQYTYLIDRDLGEKDLNAYTLGIKNNFSSVFVYEDMSIDSNVLYDIKMADYSFIILDKIIDDNRSWYKIQCDPNIINTDNGAYDFNKNIGYIEEESIQTVLNKQKLKNKIKYVKIDFDAGKGKFDSMDHNCTLQVVKGSIPSITIPKRKGYEFIKWNKDIKAASKKTTYQAVWKKVDKIRWVKKPKTMYLQGDKLDVSDGMIQVVYKDDSHHNVALSGDMVIDYNLDKIGHSTWKVETAGKILKLKVNIKENKLLAKQEVLLNQVNEVIQRNKNRKYFTKKDRKVIKNLQTKINEDGIPNIKVEQIRNLDRIYKKVWKELDVNVQSINGASFSGLRLLNEASDLSKETSMNVSLKRGVEGSHKLALKKISDVNGSVIDHYLSLKVSINNTLIKHFDSYLIVSITKDKDASSKQQYQVLREDQENVFSVKTYQTKTKIIFLAKDSGTYAITHVMNNGLGSVKDELEIDY
ncbi:MAG: glucosaminidase domain-containing protein [Erysipelotrichaceae bacterium]